jgi:hypothetical protein
MIPHDSCDIHPFRTADHNLPAQEQPAAMMDGITAFAAGKVEFMLNNCWKMKVASLLYLQYQRLN